MVPTYRDQRGLKNERWQLNSALPAHKFDGQRVLVSFLFLVSCKQRFSGGGGNVLLQSACWFVGDGARKQASFKQRIEVVSTKRWLMGDVGNSLNICPFLGF